MIIINDNNIMIFHYIKIALRNLLKYKAQTVINLFGIITALSSGLLIFLYVYGHLNSDNFINSKADIYRVLTEEENEEGQVTFAVAVPPVAGALQEYFPEVESCVRFSGEGPVVIRIPGKDNFFIKKGYVKADASLWDFFNIRLLSGNPAEALSSPESIVISKSAAEQYFGSADILGETLVMNNSSWKITGVFEDITENSHFPEIKIVSKFDFPEWASGWDGLKIPTYIKLSPNCDITLFSKKIEAFFREYDSGEEHFNGENRALKIQHFKDIHLSEPLTAEYANTIDKKILYTLFFLGVMIFIIAIVNYMNMIISGGIAREKEIGLRKVNGACKREIIFQFSIESTILFLIAASFSLIITELTLPVVNNFLNLNLDAGIIAGPRLYFLYFILIVCCGIAAGIFPAVRFSKLNTSEVLNGGLTGAVGKKRFKNILLGFQFASAFFLVSGAIIIHDQVSYMKDKDLGFEKDNILLIPVQDEKMMTDISEHLELVKRNFTSIEGIKKCSAILRPPGRIEHHDNLTIIKGEERKTAGLYNIFVDFDFIETFGIKLQGGRAFNREYKTDSGGAFIINSSAARLFGFDKPADAVGSHVSHWMGNGSIIGVTEDFHLWSLHRKIEPLFFMIPPRVMPEYLCLKLNDSGNHEILSELEQEWNKILPGYPFEYFFLNDDFNRQYDNDIIFNRIVALFAFLAILVSSFGLFSIVSLMVQQRMKEIGIRKALGSGVVPVIILFNNDFLKICIFAQMLILPLTIYVMNRYLAEFAYRLELSLYPFIAAALVTIIFALAAINSKVMKAANQSPVDAIRDE